MQDDQELQREVDLNYKAFQELLPTMLPENLGKFCLMRRGEIIDVFDTAGDAYVAGSRIYPDALFSLQEVRDAPIDLGYYSHAIPCGEV